MIKTIKNKFGDEYLTKNLDFFLVDDEEVVIQERNYVVARVNKYDLDLTEQELKELETTGELWGGNLV